MLVAIARQGTLIGAASELHLTQPAVTKSIKELEAQLGVQLLVRSGSGVRFTDYGETLLHSARLVTAEIERAERAIAQMKSATPSTLKIGLSLLSATVPVYAALSRFRARWPQTQLEIMEGMPRQIIDSLRNGEFDLCLAFIADSDSIAEFAFIPLARWPQRLMYSGAMTDSSLPELAHSQWLWNHTIESWLPFWRHLSAGETLAPPAQMTLCTSWTIYRQLALEPKTVSIWPDFLLHGDNAPKTLTPLPQALPEITLGFMVRRDHVFNRVTEHFIECVKAELK
ncbi:MAG TPA: LysR substrate-binding domain-containing protein [Scandinavium sp.]|uniref:LysR family transcriptional regulator n=1 Tax=Scandinavium sp. TaxID=2830653 RepID=UPI002E31B7AC|nr:LysR substrate-binding domain-containing protein [Scandinavium sp.]HEX4501937.1 LysR substrate-binding domain-containing protein [Scandinavium sp.]